MNSQLVKRFKVVALILGLALLALTTVATQAQSETPATATTVSGELLLLDWNQPVLKRHNGFPGQMPPLVNGNWVSPINYAGGTLYMRAQVISQPQTQNMKLQLCFWQDKYQRETCSRLQAARVGQTVTWSQPLGGMWKLNGRPIDWTRPRQRMSVSVKTANGKPVTALNHWNWAGQNPDQWYPLNMRFTAVLVAQGQTFSGWGNYIP